MTGLALDDCFIRMECRRAGIEPAAFIALVEHLKPTGAMEESLGLESCEAADKREMEIEAALDEGFENAESDRRGKIADAEKMIARLGQTKDVRTLIENTLFAALGDDGDNLIESLLDAIDELASPENAAPPSASGSR